MKKELARFRELSLACKSPLVWFLFLFLSPPSDAPKGCKALPTVRVTVAFERYQKMASGDYKVLMKVIVSHSNPALLALPPIYEFLAKMFLP